MNPSKFHQLIRQVTRRLPGRPLDNALAAWLNQEYAAGSAPYEALADACHTGVRGGWLCNREAGGIRFGRIFKATPETDGFSVDVVEMADIAGPHHAHPNGEIDLILPLDAGATFDGHPAGWCVYGPGSAHRPTVRGGRALVLYLLPDGAIEFTRAA